MSDSSFLSRWSRRKAAVREGNPVPPEPAPETETVPAAPASPVAVQQPVAERPPAPTLADVALLQPGDNISRFVASGVDETVKRAALKTLFADPHFNVMDGLDTYIDDYSKPDPIPPDVLRQLRQSETLGLFDPIEEEEAVPAVQLAEAAESDNHQPATGEPQPEPASPERSGNPAEDPPGPDKHA
ncbi:DUF3306 domain-containing protein [Cupriavidus sp. IDO]|uniref:DUF3306 domain-containing protein n=1 Tax=Cupriavidus sp. IDO TaxID=1539142 RepID=UPI00057913D5|nr:DUF3306 domain-containing protein [Cupriavidus sp. IDO]KWR90116.1 hypothetical protein RM96_10485 [Cupriavidus sp. IDO]